MKKLTLLFFILSIVSTAPVFSAASSSDITTRTQALEQQVTELQYEMITLKKDARNTTNTKHHKRIQSNNLQDTHNANASSQQVVTNRPPQISGPSSLPQSLSSTTYLPIDLDVPGQSFVSSGPYLGIPLEYAGSNLIINTPSINEDVTLLKMRQNISQRLNALGGAHYQDHSHLLLSGFVEGQAFYKGKGMGPSANNIDLTAATLDSYILGPSSWTSGLMEFNYDNDIGTNEGSLFNNARTQNSRLFISKAFIIIGDFSKSPYYGSIGQMFVPFGVYSSSMVSSPLTKLLARTNARAINMGFQQQSTNAFYGAGYIFKDDTHGATTGTVNNGGLNFGYRTKTGPFSESVGVGVIGNIADSQLMQNTDNQSASLFGGFGATGTCMTVNGVTVPCGNEKIAHKIPAYDFNGKFTIGEKIDILMEFITVSTSFSPNDLSLNSHGARPNAFHGEAIYSFDALAHPTSISAAYDSSKDALALGLPAKRYSVALNTSIWRNTLESLEARHDIDYSGSNISSGSTAIGPQGTGQSSNAITAQIDLYF